MAVDGAGLARLIELAQEPGDAGQIGRIPPAGEVGPRRTLTVGMATYDDFDGAYFTVMSLLLYHSEVADRISILIVDNNPRGKAAWALKGLTETIPGVRYVPVADVQSTAVRGRVFDEANSDWVLCVDSHVQLLPGALAGLLEFIDTHPDCTDLLQGPMLDDSRHSVFTHWEPRWRAGMFGVWATDPRGLDPTAAPFEIAMQGLGLFGCRKAAWPGFNPFFRGHGGEEGYLHEKFRAAGRRTLCLPFLRWTHRFARPDGVPFQPALADRLRNYLIGSEELGLATEPVLDHFRQFAGDAVVDDVLACWQAEKANPFSTFGAVLCLNLDRRPDQWAGMSAQFEQLGIAGRVRRIPAVEVPEHRRIGRALSHRRALELARRENLHSVLVIEDDVVFLQGAIWVLRRSLRELDRQVWNLFSLGCGDTDSQFSPVDDCAHLEFACGASDTYALAYHHRIYDRILTELPEDIAAMRSWIGLHKAFDRYLVGSVTTGAFRVRPTIAAQEKQLRFVQVDLRDQFTVANPVANSVANPHQPAGHEPAEQHPESDRELDNIS